MFLMSLISSKQPICILLTTQTQNLYSSLSSCLLVLEYPSTNRLHEARKETKKERKKERGREKEESKKQKQRNLNMRLQKWRRLLSQFAKWFSGKPAVATPPAFPDGWSQVYQNAKHKENEYHRIVRECEALASARMQREKLYDDQTHPPQTATRYLHT